MNHKILAYCALHYGSEYLNEAVGAIYPFVDKIIMLYTPEPSYGFGTQLRCPDTKADLMARCIEYNDKMQWVDVKPCHEGNHRANIFDYAAGYDGILVFDADEVLEPEDIQPMIDTCMASSCYRFGIDGYINYWKSFNEACYDGFRPIRFMNLHSRDERGNQTDVKCRIHHFGCAQRLDIMRYKLEIHGHKAEIRPNWLQDVYLGDGKENLHLVANGIWNAVPFDKTTMPDILKSHPNYYKEIIL